MKKVFINSVYTMEPKSTMKAWDNHWNYEWSGRNSLDNETKIKWRHEFEDIYTVQDKNGIIWRMSKDELVKFLKENGRVA